jgi:hypothetical protein
MDAKLLKAAVSTAQTGARSPCGVRAIQGRKRPERRILPELPREISRVDPGLRQCFRELANGRAPWPLYLFGRTGRGKTCAGLSFCDAAKYAVYKTEAELSDVLWQPDAYVWTSTRNQELLFVLDEIGDGGAVGERQYKAVKKCLDDREAWANRSAVYISNLTPAELGPLYGDAVSSRMLRGQVYELTGDDQRFVCETEAAKRE